MLFRFLLTRLVYTLPVLLIVVSLVFLMIHMVPGDPIQQMLGEGARASDVAQLRHQLGLDQPLLRQYGHFLRGLLRGDLGTSFKFNVPVTRIVLDRYPATIQLALGAMLVALLISIPAGVQAAVHRDHWQDRSIGFLSLLGLSFPNFAMGPVLILVFAIWLGLLPVSGRGSLANFVLPTITLGAGLSAILTRMVRSSMLEELGQDYVRTARAKGLPERVVVYRHALRNGMIPVLTVVGLQFGALLAGAIVTETIFSWPGLGRLMLLAISSRDYPLTQGCLLAIALTYILANFVTDFLYSVVNPRIRAG